MNDIDRWHDKIPVWAAATLLIPAPQLSAQEGQGEGGVLEEIIVTAQKREQRLQDVPVTVNVIGESVIRDANILELEDVAMLTPGLEFNTRLGRQTGAIIMRGLAPVGFTSEDTVPVYVDGFTLGFSRVQNNAQYFDLERIEVLKGPQGTLYGRNSLGGIINFVTKKPGDEVEGWLKASFGNYDAYELVGSLSGPLSDGFAIGLAARSRERDGLWDNSFTGESGVDDERDRDVRLQLRAMPGERTIVDFSLAYSESDDGCGNCPNGPIPGYDRADPTVVGRGEVNFNAPLSTVNQDVDGGFDRETLIASLNAELDLGGVLFTSITGFGDTDSFLELDLISAPGPAFGVITSLTVQRTSEVLSQELRLSSNSDSRVQWMAGLYAYQAELGRFSDVFLTFLPSGRPSTDSVTEVTNFAGFGNVEFSLTDRWSLGLGLRWDYEEVELDDRLATPGFFDSSNDEVLPKVHLSYRPSDDSHWYASVARGYKAGGFNNFIETGVSREFDAEEVWHYELGLKGRGWDDRLYYEVAAYFIDWDERQRGVVSMTGQDGIVNAGSTIVTGLEGTMSLVPAEGLTLQASLALMDSELQDIVDEGNAPAAFGWNPDYDGNSLADAPDATLAVSGQYIRPLGLSSWNLRLRADARYTGEREFHESGFLTQDPHTVVNLYAGIQNDRWQAGVFADNAFDEVYHASGGIATGIGPEFYRGDPRTYGIRLRADY